MRPEVVMLAPCDLQNYWLQISEAWAEYSALGDFYDLCDIPQMVQTPGIYQLWFACDHNKIEGLMVTIMLHYPYNKKVLHISAIAGEKLHKYLKLGLERLDHFALLMGAQTIAFDGRVGLKRLLEKHGYKQTLRMERHVVRARGN